MALVTVQRSPCRDNSSSLSSSSDEIDGYNQEKGDEKTTEKKSISECYFAVKGAALVLPHDECLHVHRMTIANNACDIQQHLQSMLYLLHDDDILKMAVKLESMHSGRTRYLVVVSHTGKFETEESCLLGIDCNKKTTIGLVLPVWADTNITLDGDGGFSVTSIGRHHIFKPVSVQAMWSALQSLHKASSKAREYNYFKCGGTTHQWVDYYDKHINSDRSCLNEWHAMDDIVSRRPLSPDSIRLQPTEREETEKHIRTKLKELMMSVDLDEVTSKYIRSRLEEILDMDLKEYKSFIDQEMLTILGQMDAPTEIFQYLYLGSEWNASNLEELVVNGIGYILNVTREIDNFFPGMFNYQNVRVYDDESTEILHYWDKTYRYIRRAKDEGSKVLVHCKMGISRSASVVIAYVMKAYDWNLQQALDFVKTKRGCIKPNSGFLKQLEIYEGILDASKQRHNSLWRSKSETNLESPKLKKKCCDGHKRKQEVPEKSESLHHLQVSSLSTSRPKSWSPNDAVADILFPPQSLSYNLSKEKENISSLNCEPVPNRDGKKENSRSTDMLNVDIPLSRVSSIKDRINELELQVSSTGDKFPKGDVKSPSSLNRSGHVFSLANQFESGSKPSSPVDEGLIMKFVSAEEIVEPVLSQTKPPAHKHHAVLIKPSLWPEDGSFVADTENRTILQHSTNVPLNKVKNPSDLLFISKTASDTIVGGVPEEESNCSYKASHSPFKTLDTSSSTETRCSFDKKPSTYSANYVHTSENKVPERTCDAVFPDESPSVFSSKETKSDKFSAKLLAKNSNSYSLPIIKPPLRTLSLACTSILSTVQRSRFYDKEDIPFTPGKVMRTKQKIEEKNLTRTTSFDSGFPLQTYSTPSTSLESDMSPKSIIRRSHSLRHDSRATIPFYGKWYPLPALTLDTLPVMTDELQCSENSMVHSVSSPSVVEAVNQVISGAQKEAPNSAINILPSDNQMSSIRSGSVSVFEFGSVSSLPDMDLNLLAPNESPVPGLVKQQREILENKVIKTPSDVLCNLHADTCKLLPDQKSSLVSDLLKQEDIKESGIVKRLKKELEAKSTLDTCRKNKSLSDFTTESGNVLPALDRFGGPISSDLQAAKQCSSISSCQGLFGESKVPPPTPHRKTSLDLSFLQKRFPLSIKLGAQPTVPVIKPIARTSDSISECPKSLLQPSAKFSPCIPPPPPPPLGMPRKLRKQQGSTHPLSKLIRQRHPNPLYNTM